MPKCRLPRADQLQVLRVVTLLSVLSLSSPAFGNPPKGQLVSWGSIGISYTGPGTKFTGIAAGCEFNLAITSAGKVVGWGLSLDHQLAIPPNVTNVVAVVAGFYHSLALQQDGRVIAWGGNNSGQGVVPPE